MQQRPVSRRNLVIGATVFGAYAVVRPAFAGESTPTPRQTPWPFYPQSLPLDHDTDLTWVRGQAEQSPGTITDVMGRVLTASGKAVPGVRVEIWQCDAKGYYHHPHDRGGRADPRFQNYGRTSTDEQGQYRFRTIRPIAYPGRAPHIHFSVAGRGIRRLTTQMYIACEAANARGIIYNSIHDIKSRMECDGSA